MDKVKKSAKIKILKNILDIIEPKSEGESGKPYLGITLPKLNFNLTKDELYYFNKIISELCEDGSLVRTEIMLSESYSYIEKSLVEPIKETVNIIKGEDYFKEKLRQIN